MKTLSLVLLLLLFCSVAAAGDLPRSTPEEQGISSNDVAAFVTALDNIETMNSVMVVRHGHVVAEGYWTPYNAKSPHSLYSLSKSFTSTAMGIAIAQGHLQLHDKVLEFFPDDAPDAPSANLKSMRVSDLLRMSTGQQTEPPRTPNEPWTKTFLSHPVPFKPGTHFVYNTSATYMQSAIVQKATGMTVLDFLQPRLFEPLGIEKPTWEMSPQGIATGGYGLSLRTEDIAKFGQLYLQKGKWEGKQLVPEAWVEAATSRQTSNGSNPQSDWDQGYGYQFWRCRNGAYRGDGAFGQYCIVMPEQDAVLVITSGVKNMQEVLDVVWGQLLHKMKKSSLRQDDAAATKLTQMIEKLTVKRPMGTATAPDVLGKTFIFSTNERKLESISLVNDDKKEAVTLVAKIAGQEQSIACGRDKWRNSKFGWGKLPSQPASASGAWTEKDTFTAKLCFYETPFVVIVKLQFGEKEVRYSAETNVDFGSTKEKELVGKIE